MRTAGGQAMVEMALVMPVILAFAFGTVETARVADARSGLDAATMAAVTAAARAPDASTATAAAGSAFAASVGGYPLEDASVTVALGGFVRGAPAVATGTAKVRLDFLPIPGVPRTLVLTSTAVAHIQAWRSR